MWCVRQTLAVVWVFCSAVSVSPTAITDRSHTALTPWKTAGVRTEEKESTSQLVEQNMEQPTARDYLPAPRTTGEGTGESAVEGGKGGEGGESAGAVQGEPAHHTHQNVSSQYLERPLSHLVPQLPPRLAPRLVPSPHGTAPLLTRDGWPRFPAVGHHHAEDHLSRRVARRVASRPAVRHETSTDTEDDDEDDEREEAADGDMDDTDDDRQDSLQADALEVESTDAVTVSH